MRKYLILFCMLLLPLNIYAYSNRVAVGGETIGIEVHSKGLYVVGFYAVNNKYIGKDAGFRIGDRIIRINDQDIIDVNSLNNIVDSNTDYVFTIMRNDEEVKLKMNLSREGHAYKTGLYVKDQINGIGTLSYIDPETKIYGSLGHEILESASYSKFDISGGSIYKAIVSSIKKSINGLAGEKNADFDINDNFGEVNRNEINGIFGKYSGDFSTKDVLEVARPSEIHKGEAKIRTVIQLDKVEEFSINILSIDENNLTKNILFEITDDKLLSKTGGIVQGMSGSPIIQDNKIIGVVNYVIVDDTKKGYGIFITTMLKEGDKILS